MPLRPIIRIMRVNIWARRYSNHKTIPYMIHHNAKPTAYVRDRGEMQTRYALTLIQNALIGEMQRAFS
jgi:hypothetical protein